MVRSSLRSSDDGGCALEMLKDDDSSAIDSVMERRRAAVSSTEMASMVGYLVEGWNAPLSQWVAKRDGYIRRIETPGATKKGHVAIQSLPQK